MHTVVNKIGRVVEWEEDRRDGSEKEDEDEEEDEDEAVEDDEDMGEGVAQVGGESPVRYYESAYAPSRPFKWLKGDLRIKFPLPPLGSRAQLDADEHTDIPADATELTYSGPVNQVPVKLLRLLWRHAHVSGFGDVRSQTTKVDAGVRNARELRLDEFEVDPLMGLELARVWSENLFPKRLRAVPCKINIYGPRWSLQRACTRTRRS